MECACCSWRHPEHVAWIKRLERIIDTMERSVNDFYEDHELGDGSEYLALYELVQDLTETFLGELRVKYANSI